VPQALAELREGAPTAAILDINLGSETSLPIADRLHALGIPFLFATGYGEQAQLPAIHADVPVLQKPYTIEGVAKALSALLGSIDD
jgi:DNA-binding response OmpR family regulator